MTFVKFVTMNQIHCRPVCLKFSLGVGAEMVVEVGRSPPGKKFSHIHRCGSFCHDTDLH